MGLVFLRNRLAWHSPSELRNSSHRLSTSSQEIKMERWAHRQSLDVVSALKDTGSPVEYFEIEADHSFDKEPIYRMESLYNFFQMSTRKD